MTVAPSLALPLYAMPSPSGPGTRAVSRIRVNTPAADALTCSIVFDGATQVGIVGSGGYGHRIGKSIALAYVRKDLSAPGSKLEIEILGQRYAATVAAEPIYDPKNERLRA